MLFVFSTPVLIRHLWQLKAVVFLHSCVILLHAVLRLSEIMFKIILFERYFGNTNFLRNYATKKWYIVTNL